MAKSKKEKTWEQVEATQAKAVAFLRNVVGDSDKADEIDALSPGEYAERKGFVVKNPAPKSRPKQTKQRSKAMPQPEISRYAGLTKDEILIELEDRDQELEEAESTLDEVWAVLCDSDDQSSKEELIDLCDEAAEVLSDYDPERFPVDASSDEADDLEEAA